MTELTRAQQAHPLDGLAAVTLQSPDGDVGTLIGPADRLAELVRPEAVVPPAADRSPVNTPRALLTRPELEQLVEDLERRATEAEALAASRLAKIVDLLDELANRDDDRRAGRQLCELLIAPMTTCGEPVLDDDDLCGEHRARSLEDLVRQLAEERRAAGPLVGYAVGFPAREDGPLPYLSHTAETRERADRVLGYARRGEPRYAVYAVHGPLADPTPEAEVAP